MKAPNEHLLQSLFHVQAALGHIDHVHSQTMPSDFSLSLQKKLRNFDNYVTRQMKIMKKLYEIDEEAMRTFEDAFSAKVDEVVSKDIKDFLKIEEDGE
jgi:hypothetical protein